MKHIKKIIFLSGFLCTAIAHAKDSYQKIINTHLPFSLQLSLDLIGLELAHYKNLFKIGWTTNVHAQVIIEEAEILVQTASKEFQNRLKIEIIDLFKKEGLLIRFTKDNKIVPQTVLIIVPDQTTDDSDDDSDKDDVDAEKRDITKEKHLKIKKPKKHKKQEAKQIFAPKRIHGARRTMKRLKKEREEKIKRNIELIKAQIKAKKDAILKAKQEALIAEEARIRKNTIDEQKEFTNGLLKRLTKEPNDSPDRLDREPIIE